MKILTYDVKKRRNVVVGNLSSTIFTKKVTNKHYMIIESGYGIQESVLNLLKTKGCKEIHIQTKKKLIVTNIDEWFSYGHKKDYGHGLQVFLNIKGRGINNGKN